VYGTKGIASLYNVPGGRDSSVSWIDECDNLWLFSGINRDIFLPLNDLWKFDGIYWTWLSGSNETDQPGNYGTKGIASSDNTPGARYYGSSAYDSHYNFFLASGAEQESCTLFNMFS
jgi:hypothetical protein